MKLKYFALITGLLPIIAVNTAYITGVYSGHLPSCIPYLEGCTSISATGRLPPESLIFKGTMIPVAVFMIVYWWLSYQWLMSIGDNPTIGNRVMLWLGMISGLFLIIYTVALGLIGPQYAMQRRIGVTFFFSFTFLAQLILVHRINQVILSGKWLLLKTPYRAKLILCILMLLLGITISPLKVLYPEKENLEIIIEWDFALLMYSYFVVSFFTWQKSSFGLTLASIDK